MRRILALCVLALVSPAAVEAGSITVSDFIGVNVTYTFRGDTFSAARLGSVLMSNGSNISPSIDGRTFEAYCVDIFGPIFDPGTPQPPAEFDATASLMSVWTDTNAGPGPRVNAGRQTAWMYRTFVADLPLGDTSRTGLLMATWNVLYDDDFTVNPYMDALFSVDPPTSAGVISEANRYLKALSNNLAAANLSDATWLILQEQCDVPPCRDVQNFVGPLDQVTPVPEPGSTALLLLSGLGGIAAARRRRCNTWLRSPHT
jgi:hypothetical protein